MIEACSAMELVPEKSIMLFSHILNAHHRWNAVMNQKKPEYGSFQVHELNNWAEIHYENQRSSFEITTNADDFEKRIDYENDEGRLFTNTLQDVLFHIINHSAHHRGQIAMNFSDNGVVPISLDYINYKR